MRAPGPRSGNCTRWPAQDPSAGRTGALSALVTPSRKGEQLISRVGRQRAAGLAARRRATFGGGGRWAAHLITRAPPAPLPQVDRRQALGFLAGAAALVAAQPSEAAYGEAARVFASKATNPTGEAPGARAPLRGRLRGRAGTLGSTALALHVQAAAARRLLGAVWGCRLTTRCPPRRPQASPPTPARALRCCCPPSGAPARSATSPMWCSATRTRSMT